MKQPFYQFRANSLKGKEVKMSDYAGKVVLIVNTASKCGLTPQYEALEALYKKYKDQGLIVLGFPCNQFGAQEPGDEKSIAEGCLINYGVTFPMFAKINVNGPKAHPIFSYLKKALPGLFTKRVKWNFTKFLLDTEGRPIKRFSPLSKPEQIEKHIQKLLNK